MECRGEGRADFDPCAGGRLGKTELGGVEEVAIGVEWRERVFVDGEMACGTVECVANDRMMQSGKVDTNLMCAACFQA